MQQPVMHERNTHRQQRLSIRKDLQWALIWGSGVALVLLWNTLFLNRPAFKLIMKGLYNTFFVAVSVCIFTLVLSWCVTNVLHTLQSKQIFAGYMVITFLLNLIRSIPQIVGVLFGYILLAFFHKNGVMGGDVPTFLFMAITMSVVIFIEMVDLMRERIAYFMKLDFYNAMRVCGIREWRIINKDILWKNSRIHILNKLISVFGIAVFLQCSVDFIISVGLSTSINAVNLPPTLGSLLAKIDSKQDILAIGHTLTHPFYLKHLFLDHLQGITVAFLIVFTLVCIYKVSSGYAERHQL